MTFFRNVGEPSASKGMGMGFSGWKGSSTKVTMGAAMVSPSFPFSLDSPFCAASEEKMELNGRQIADFASESDAVQVMYKNIDRL